MGYMVISGDIWICLDMLGIYGEINGYIGNIGDRWGYRAVSGEIC